MRDRWRKGQEGEPSPTPYGHSVMDACVCHEVLTLYMEASSVNFTGSAQPRIAHLEIFMRARAHPSGAGVCDGHRHTTSLERRGIVQVPHATASTAFLCDSCVRKSPTAGTVVFAFAKRESSPSCRKEPRASWQETPSCGSAHDVCRPAAGPLRGPSPWGEGTLQSKLYVAASQTLPSLPSLPIHARAELRFSWLLW